jgi:hypothetical protein
MGSCLAKTEKGDILDEAYKKANEEERNFEFLYKMKFNFTNFDFFSPNRFKIWKQRRAFERAVVWGESEETTKFCCSYKLVSPFKDINEKFVSLQVEDLKFKLEFAKAVGEDSGSKKMIATFHEWSIGKISCYWSGMNMVENQVLNQRIKMELNKELEEKMMMKIVELIYNQVDL